MSETQYLPGVCNIGPAEIKMRMTVGWIGLAVTAIMWTLFVVFDVNPIARLTVFFPAVLACHGFFQAGMKFCSGYAAKGVFNFGPKLGTIEKVERSGFQFKPVELGEPGQSELAKSFKQKDMKKARQIALYSSGISAVVAVLAYLIR